VGLALVGGSFSLTWIHDSDTGGSPRQVLLREAFSNEEGEGGGDYERISDEEFMRRAAASPDQAAIHTLFRRGAEGNRGFTGGLNWEPLGPRPFVSEYWTGEDDAGGRVCALLVDPDYPDVIYAGAAQGGVWKSTDAGVTWTPMSDFLSSLATGALCFDSYDPDVIYYGTGEQHFSGDSFYGDGLFRSDDAGVTWTKIALKADVGSYIARVKVDPFDNQIIYVASELGFVRSTDGGASWHVKLGPGYCTDIAMDPVDSGVVYCAFKSSGIWKSTNNGSNWSKLEGGLPAAGFSRINFALAPSNHQVLYAAFADGSGDLYGMWKTADAGNTWTELTATPDYLHPQGNYDNCIIVDPEDEDIVYAGGTFPFGGEGDYGLVKTTDGGASWTDISIGIDGSQPHPDHHIFAFGSDGRLWLGNDGGVFYTDDGGLHWVDCNNRLSIGQIYEIATHPTDSNFLLGGTQDNGSARFEGVEGWPQVTAGDAGPSAVEWDSPNIYYTSSPKLGTVYKFDDGVYQGNVEGPWDGDRTSWCNAPLIIDPNQANTLLAGTHRVWRTTNSGADWTAISDDLTGGGYLLSIAVAEGASDIIYTGSNDGEVYFTDDASNWYWSSDGLPQVPIPAIVINPADWQDAYLCADQTTDGRVFHSIDAGASWSDITGDLPTGLRGLSLAADFRTTPPRLYLGTDYGVYASLDDGTTWIKAETNIPNLAIYDLVVDNANSYLLAGTHGRGMWRALLDVTGPDVQVTSPIGGETWQIDGTYDITWTASDTSGVDSVSVLLSRDGGVNYPEVLASGIENTGLFEWTATGPASATCRVKVIAYDGAFNEASSESPADFEIEEAGTAVEGGTPLETALLALDGNPVHLPTTFRYHLAESRRVSLKIFDLQGRLVRSLDEGSQPSGTHSVMWDGRDMNGNRVSSGVFFYRLEAGSFRQSRRMILLR